MGPNPIYFSSADAAAVKLLILLNWEASNDFPHHQLINMAASVLESW